MASLEGLWMIFDAEKMQEREVLECGRSHLTNRWAY